MKFLRVVEENTWRDKMRTEIHKPGFQIEDLL
jgi:hypothetical protein